MARARVEDEFDASVDEVWALIRDFGDLRAWAPGGKVTKVEGEGIGAIRHVESPFGYFKERCEAHDEARHSFSYAVLESPAPLKDYVATVKLREQGPRSCTIEWSSEFESPETPEGEMVQTIENVYAAFIAAIKSSLAEKAG